MDNYTNRHSTEDMHNAVGAWLMFIIAVLIAVLVWAIWLEL